MTKRVVLTQCQMDIFLLDLELSLDDALYDTSYANYLVFCYNKFFPKPGIEAKCVVRQRGLSAK